MSLTTAERSSIDLSSTIKGWGSDLDPMVRPGVPRDKAPGIGAEKLYIDVPQQTSHLRVLKSNEHGRLTPVFGSTCPPKGLSGLMRRFAFRFSEGQLSHWVVLLAADRVDMMEDMLMELLRLRVPNVPKEMGLAAEWKYNRKNAVKKAALAGAGVLAWMAYKRVRAARA